MYGFRLFHSLYLTTSLPGILLALNHLCLSGRRSRECKKPCNRKDRRYIIQNSIQSDPIPSEVSESTDSTLEQVSVIVSELVAAI